MAFDRKLLARLVDRRVLLWTLVGLALVLAHGPTLVAHIRYGAAPGVFNNDARQQIFPFFRYGDRELFPNDYLGQYFLDCLPIGFRALYTAGAVLWDAALLSKAVPYVLLLITAVAVAAAAAALGTRWSAFASASLVLGNGLFMLRMSGGLPRAFAFPLLAVALALLAAGRLRLLAALVPLAAAFYPTAAVPIGLALGCGLLLLPARDRGDMAGAPLGRRLTWLVGAAAITVAVITPPMMGSRRYGQLITPEMVEEYPEAGPGGRYWAEDRAPFKAFFPESLGVVRELFHPEKEPLVPEVREWLATPGVSKKESPPRHLALDDILFATIVLGGASLASRSAAARRVLLLAATAFAAHLVSRFVSPYLYLPTRYLLFPLPLLAVVLLPAGAAEVARPLPSRWAERARPIATAVAALVLLACIGAHGDNRAGLSAIVKPDDTLYAAVSELRKDALIAGWPHGPIENVPYACRRQVLLAKELHQAFHTGFVHESRRRMRAFVDAYFATSTEPIRRLRDEFGVTHLLLEPSHLKGDGPEYFAPFGSWIAEATRRADGQEYELLRLMPTLATFRNRHYAILDLSRLP